MSDHALQSFAGCLAVICILGTAFLVESRPPSDGDGVMSDLMSDEREFFGNETVLERDGAQIPGHSRTRNMRGKRSAGVRHVRDEPANATNSDSKRIVFPNEKRTPSLGPKSGGSQLKFLPDVDNFKACAAGKRFCEEIDSYPEQQLETLLMNESILTMYQGFFGKDKSVDSEIKNKYDDDDVRDEPLCKAAERYTKPVAGETEKNKPPVFIVNHPNNTKWQQVVRIEECRGSGGPCSRLATFPDTYRAVCKQKYVYRRVLAVTPTGEFYPEQVQFPSCCVCTLTQNEAPLADRMGNPMTPNPNTAKQGKP